MKIFVAHSSAFDFRAKVYEPIRASDLNAQHTFYLPQETGDEDVTRELIKSCDIVIAEVSLPSTGMGIELGWADAFGVPILCVHEEGTKYSGSLEYVTKHFASYGSTDEFVTHIRRFIAELVH